ncbi:MAG: FAD-binding oxidoreductase [Polyangiaceae bacterium]|nr:FAD-binding oxidoreductase [Polyangiaceae bacterium]
MKRALVAIVGADNVLDSESDLEPYREDYCEADPVDPSFVVFARTTEEVQVIVKLCASGRTPITPRVAGSNVGGLALPAPGGIVLDLSRMNRIVSVDTADMYAVIEPGVTQADLKRYLVEQDIPLTFGFSLAPPDTSVLANCLLGGLTNRSLKYGDQSQWVSGLEVVLADGSLVRTGSWALSDSAFGLVPFPDVSGMFIGWQGATGITTRMAFQLWPRHRLNKRLFVLTYSAHGTFEAVRRLCRTELCDDIGGLSWPSAKMMMGVKNPYPEPATGEPTFFLYVDLTAETAAEMALKEGVLEQILADIHRKGDRIEEPLDVATLLRVNPALGAFAEFPVELEFLTNHGGGGLTWIGTYGPLSRFEDGIAAGTEIMVRRGFPPLIVTRPMRGGHYGVLRFVAIFDKKSPEEVARIRELNLELLEMVTDKGFVMYKTPPWAWEKLRGRIDPGMLELMRRMKRLVDPLGIMNPGKLGF